MINLPIGKIPFLSLYISSTNYDKALNQLTYVNGGALKTFTPKAYNNQVLELIINSKFNHLCSLTRGEKLVNNRCVVIDLCDNTKYEKCVDSNTGIICKEGLLYGK